jgi:LuxR family transcriptional regulator, maltose regulon positive regulatory protein
MVVSAGPGFGKTTVLAAAAQRDVPADSSTHWLTCDPADAEAMSLGTAIAETLGVDGPSEPDAIARAVWMRTPTQVCLVLDDVHEIPADSSGARWLSRLVDQLPENFHLVLATRSAIPISLARIAAQGHLGRLDERDLLFDDDELQSFAKARQVDLSVLASSGGWPALAELSAAAQEDLVYEFVWDEILEHLGRERVRHLALLAVVGGGDDDILQMITGSDGPIVDLVRGVPLVTSNDQGWLVLHSLWQPVLRPLLTRQDIEGACRAAASVHRTRSRYGSSISLFAEIGAWDEVLATLRLAEIDPAQRLRAHEFLAWHAVLPVEHRAHPAALFAAAIGTASRLPTDAVPRFEAAWEGFRAQEDVEAEVAVIQEHGVVLWWANDLAGLLVLLNRATELAETGSRSAAMLVAIGAAGIAHINADSAGVLAALAGIEAAKAGSWFDVITWLRHVAHRRAGDLERAMLTLDEASEGPGSNLNPNHTMSRLRTDWLCGRVDHVPGMMRELESVFRDLGNRYLDTELALELAARSAWLGDRVEARRMLDAVEPMRSEMPGALARILWLIATATMALDSGDEADAADLLRGDPHSEPGRADNWYWLDRTAVALLHVLLPEHRASWDERTFAPAHRFGIEMARVLELSRAGDETALVRFVWPSPGLARAHFPAIWLLELIRAGDAVGNPAPEELLAAFASTERMRSSIPIESVGAEGVVPSASVDEALVPRSIVIKVLGPLVIERDGLVVEHAHLHRRRVRELLVYLIVHGRARRDRVADVLWPDHASPRHNLRVTLNYLQEVLDPLRKSSPEDAVIRTDKHALALAGWPDVYCDLWSLAQDLDAAESAEAAGLPERALEAYDRALRCWSGRPFDDDVDVNWIRDEQTRWCRRVVVAAVRAGNLHMAMGAYDRACDAARRALIADELDEPAHQLLAAAHLALGHQAVARDVLEGYVLVLSDLDVEPSDRTRELLEAVRGRQPLTYANADVAFSRP